jgi:signal transduction histidine kinase
MSKPSHILIVDDKEDTRDLLTQLLENDYRISTAADGREAIAMIARDRPDLVLLDLLMPGVDGFAVLGYLADHHEPFLPVIVRSAVTQREARLRALSMGANEFLGTPFDEEELAVRIHSMMALKEARDTAERRARELEHTVADRTRELRLTLEDLRKTNRYKEEFLAVVSHELRTPLGMLIAYAYNLEDGAAGEMTDAQHEMVLEIAQSGERMMELVSNLVDMSLVAAGKLNVYLREECYPPLVEQALAAVRPLAEAKRISISTDLDVPEPVSVDDHRTVQVLTNLVKNAVNFTEPGGQVAIKAFLRQGRLVTEIADTGIGISEDDQTRLFQHFRQLDMSSTRKVGGFGLGLSMAKAIVEAHGGQIGVRSRTGDGSTFWFDLPERQAEGLVLGKADLASD